MDINNGKLLNSENSIKQSIELILTTTKGSCVLDRDFGSSLIEYIDQPINNVFMQIQGEVVKSLQSQDTRILVDKVNLTLNEENKINLIINYNQGDALNVNLT